jgi:ABC-type nitrate/sulfonate/bicarbonate transport system substrate-binding protein
MHMKMSKNVLKIVGAVAAVVIIGGVGFQITQKNAGPIRVGMVEWAGFYPIVCGVQRGDFKKAGLDISVKIYKDNPSANSAVEKGEVDIVGLTLGDLLMINASRKVVRVFYVADQSGEGDAIVGKAEIKTPQDLRGKIISIENVNSFSHMFVLQFLRKFGLSEADVTFKDVAASDVAKELVAGTIDAGHTWDPTKAEAIKAGFHMIGSAADVPGAVMDLLAYNARLMQDRHDDIVKFSKVLGAVNLDAWTKPTDECVKLVADYHQKTPQEIIDSYPGVIHKSAAEQFPLMDPHGVGDLTLNSISRFVFSALKKNGQLFVDPDYDFIFDATVAAAGSKHD